MALLLITNPPTTLAVSSDWTDLVTRSNGNMLGHGLSIPIFTLTNWDATTTIPEIAEGSIIEVGGSFYQADADTALTPEAGIIDGTVHIKLVPAGGGASVVPTLTNDAIPAWSANKAGWYDTLDKFLPFEMTKATAVYTEKSEYIDQNKTIKIGESGSIYPTAIYPTDSPTNGSATLTSDGETYYFPRGIYNITLQHTTVTTPGYNIIVLEIYVNGEWSDDITSSQSSLTNRITPRFGVVSAGGVSNGAVRARIFNGSGTAVYTGKVSWEKF